MKSAPTRPHNNRKSARSNSLATYLSLTAGAGAVAAVNANGAIIYYNGPALTIDVNESLFWNPVTMQAGINQGGSEIFKLNYASTDYIYGSKATGDIDSLIGWAGASFGSTVPAKLGGGATIDASTPWFSNTWMYLNRSGWTTADSPWATGQDGTRGYIPFQFYYTTNNSNIYYGWADITYNNGPTATLVLNNFAYENNPNTAITTGGGPAPVPEPATVVSGILLLAMGGTKVLMARRRKKANQA